MDRHNPNRILWGCEEFTGCPCCVQMAPAMTFAEIGKELGLSREMVRVIYKGAMRKLARNAELRGIWE